MAFQSGYWAVCFTVRRFAAKTIKDLAARSALECDDLSSLSAGDLSPSTTPVHLFLAGVFLCEMEAVGDAPNR
jgi:hypothetical protein